jgi:hypothetical protein
MIDPVMKGMFENMVLPTMRLMPTTDLVEVRDFLVGELDKELLRREIALRAAGAVLVTDEPDD